MISQEDDKDMKEMLQEELKELTEREEQAKELQIMLLPKDPNDKECFVEIRGGTGGEKQHCL